MFSFRSLVKRLLFLTIFMINFASTIYLYAQWPPGDDEGNVDFESSNIPVIIINTDGQRIRNDPRIAAEMGVIDNAEGQRNYLTDSCNVYKGRIAIETRGSSSGRYPKQQYRLELQDENGEDLNVSLLGLPEENDWILYGPYDDETLIRNAFCYTLSNKIGRYASRTRFCEVILDDDYRGVYLLVEKIKRDKNRVSISKMDSTDIEGDAVTGGYIVKIDKDAGENVGGWRSESGTRYQYDYPKPDRILPEQKEYIKHFFDDFESAMSTDWETDQSYLNYIDISSFVDHFILNEFAKNVDAYRISAFMYKDRDSEGGRLTMGPIWDMNLTMSKAWYPDDQGLTEGWEVDYGERRPQDGYQPPFWWVKIAHSNHFEQLAQQRWQSLRTDLFKKENLYSIIDSLLTTIDEARLRNFEKWPDVLDRTSYDNEIQTLKQWISERIDWIDVNIQNLATSVSEPQTDQIVNSFKLFQNYPNPFNAETTISFALPKPTRVTLAIYNIMGSEIRTLSNKYFNAGFHTINCNAQHIPSGNYILSISTDYGYSETKKITLLK